MIALKPLDPSVKHIDYLSITDDEQTTWFESKDMHPDLRVWFEKIPLEERMHLERRDGRLFLSHKENEIEITLSMYRYGRDPSFALILDITSGITDGDKIPNTSKEDFAEVIHIEKLRLSAEEYNRIIQWESDEEHVYPTVCDKCGHYMAIRRDKYEEEADSGILSRLRCTNHECGNIIVSEQFTEDIRAHNARRFKENFTKNCQNFLDPVWGFECYTQGEAEDFYRSIFPNSNLEKEFICKECGFQGQRIVRAVWRNEFTKQDHNTMISAYCPCCLGSNSSAFGNFNKSDIKD